MTALQAALLGVIQGITEFLPISSSAHLILTSRVLGWPDQGLAFDMAAHVGSLVAVVAYFRSDLARLAAAALPSTSAGAELVRDRRLLTALALATIPVALAGLLFQGVLGAYARDPVLIAGTTIFFGLLLGWADWRGGRLGEDRIGLGSTIVIGLAQALALVPGTSRSGVTITAGVFCGLTKEAAARFSFLLAVPVGLLVAGKELVDMITGAGVSGGWMAAAIGFLASALSAYLTIDWLLAWLRRRGFLPFVVYRLVLGVVLLAAFR